MTIDAYRFVYLSKIILVSQMFVNVGWRGENYIVISQWGFEGCYYISTVKFIPVDQKTLIRRRRREEE